MIKRYDFLNKVNIKDVIGSRSLLKEDEESEHKFIGLCPFHHENTPSFTVDTNAQSYNCLGCQKQGDALDFMMELELMMHGDGYNNVSWGDVEEG